MELVKQEWYESLIDDVQAIMVEGVFNHHWTLIETYHQIGRRIYLDEDKMKKSGIPKEQIVQRVATHIGRGKRMIRYAIKFYEKFPDLDRLPEGKNITMKKVIDIYLTEGKKEKVEITYHCPKCNYEDKPDAFRS